VHACFFVCKCVQVMSKYNHHNMHAFTQICQYACMQVCEFALKSCTPASRTKKSGLSARMLAWVGGRRLVGVETTDFRNGTKRRVRLVCEGVCVYSCECVCVRERERESPADRARECVCEREGAGVSASVCVDLQNRTRRQVRLI